VRIPWWTKRSELRQKAKEAEAKLVAEKPTKKKRRRRLPKRLTREETDALLAQPDLDDWRGLRDRCTLELMYRAGLRVSEVVSLRPRDVEDTGAVHVWEGKGGVDRTSYFDPSTVLPLLQRWLAVRASETRVDSGNEAPLFCAVNGKGITTRTVQLMVERHRLSAGITTKCTPHSLRHTFASELIEEGFSTREVQELLGHASVATTEVYTHISSDRLSAKVHDRNRDRVVR